MPERIVVTDPEDPSSGGPPLPEEITESIAIGGALSISAQPSSLSNLAYANSIANVNLAQQNAVSNQQAINQVGVSVLGVAVNMVADLDPLEAVSAVTVMTGNVVAQEMIDIEGAIGAFQPPGPGPNPTMPTVKKNKTGGITLDMLRSQFPVTINAFGPGEKATPET